MKLNVALYEKLRRTRRVFVTRLAELSGVKRATIHAMYARREEYGRNPRGIASVAAVNAALRQMNADKT